jgi:hypothetical protein
MGDANAAPMVITWREHGVGADADVQCRVQRARRAAMGPRAVSANRWAVTVGVSQETLSRWLRQARSVMPSPMKRTPRWTSAEKLRVVLAAEGLEDEALGALRRQEELHAAQLTE